MRLGALMMMGGAGVALYEMAHGSKRPVLALAGVAAAVLGGLRIARERDGEHFVGKGVPVKMPPPIKQVFNANLASPPQSQGWQQNQQQQQQVMRMMMQQMMLQQQQALADQQMQASQALADQQTQAAPQQQQQQSDQSDAEASHDQLAQIAQAAAAALAQQQTAEVDATTGAKQSALTDGATAAAGAWAGYDAGFVNADAHNANLIASYLTRWSHGDRTFIADVQRFLGAAADGYIGSRTLAAIRQFQERAGLPPSGLMDFETMSALSLG